ncbi:MAG: hypothetical protein IPM29_15715, partial [Planctomycetes bacterium]|nr:hypothetical protein [Planctomycetota bacterium]
RTAQPRDGAVRVRAQLGRRRRGDLQPRQPPRARADPREGHGRADRPLPVARRAAPRRADAARGVRADRAVAVRRRRYRRAVRQGEDRAMEPGRGADPADRQARPVHHEHGLRGRRHRRRRVRRPAHQGQLLRDPRAGRPRRVRPRCGDPQARPPAVVDARSDLQPARPRQPHHRRLRGAGRRDRPQPRARRGPRGGVPPHARAGRTDDRRQAAERHRADHPLPARPLPRRRGPARHTALRARVAAEGGRLAAARRDLGHRRGLRVARLPDRAPARRAATLSRRRGLPPPLAERGAGDARARMRETKRTEALAVELLDLEAKPAEARDAARIAALREDPLVRYVLDDALANVLCPATKLWNTGHGANTMREAVSLVGGYGITEDCPGFLGQKWMDAQLEATYEGPEAVQRRQLSVTMTSPVFLRQLEGFVREQRELADRDPSLGACTLGTAMQLWLWTLKHLREADDADGRPLYHSTRQGVTFLMADALCWLLASRAQMLDVLELQKAAPDRPDLADALPGTVRFFADLCRAQAARAAGEVGRICAELVFGYQRHPTWESCGSCYRAGDLQALESLIPGIDAVGRAFDDVVEADGSHPKKAGPCVSFHGFEAFSALRRKLDGCLVEAHLAKDRAARALAGVMIPEALDYPG